MPNDQDEFAGPGYEPGFLGSGYEIGYPDYKSYSGDIARNQQTGEDLLPYTYYSVLQSRSRRVPIFSASNIYRVKFTQIERHGSFKRDKRIHEFEQLLDKDYSAFNTIKAAAIEKGHMTKREDVQWDIDANEENAHIAALHTFYYPNASPQHDKLNNGIWKHLENSIIIKGRVPVPAKVSVFTGPVLDSFDPKIKVKLPDGSDFKIPVLFWKVIYYIKEDKKLYCAGFLMGQLNPLKRDNIIEEVDAKAVAVKKKVSSLKPFLDFKEDENYQVPISMIEELTRLKFAEAIDLHKDNPPVQLSQVQVKSIGSFRGPGIPDVKGLNV